VVLVAFFVLVYCALGVIAWRHPLLARLAFREAVRRPWQSVLVVAGLTVGTSMILTSLIMADSFTMSLSQATYQSWGRVDILVSANGEFFSPSVASGLADSAGLRGKLRGVQAGVELFGVAADLDRKLDNPTVRLIGFDSTSQAAFGGFTLVDGRRTTGQDLGPSDLLLTQSLANSLQAQKGDTIRIAANGLAPATFKVFGIATREGPGDYGAQPAVFATLPAMAAVTGSAQINVVRLSSLGDGRQEMLNSQQIAPAVAAAVRELSSDVKLQVRTAKAADVIEIESLAAQNVPINFLWTSFIVLAGIALVVNLALALAEERRPHLAVLRAMGLSRAGLIATSLIEGGLYSLLAAGIGTAPGIGAGWLVISNAYRWIPEVREKGASVVLIVSTQAVVIAIATGALVTLLALLVASVRTTRLSIASAVRFLPDLPGVKGSGRGIKVGIAVLGLAGLVAATAGNGSVRLLGGIAVIATAGLLLGGRMPDRARWTLVGIASVVWLFGVYTTLSWKVIEADLPATLVLLPVSTVALSLVVAVNIRVVERLIPRTLVAQLTRRTSRLVLAATAIGLVLSLVAFVGVFVASTNPDYERDAGGYDVSVTSASNATFSLPADLQSKVAGQLMIRSSEYFGPVRSTGSDRGPGPLDWHQQIVPLYAMSDEQLAQSRLPFASYETRFASPSEVWASLRRDPSLVVSGSYPVGADVEMIGAKGPQHFHVAARFSPGFLDGILGSQLTVAGLSPGPAGTTLLLRLRPGVDAVAFAIDVRRSQFPNGVEAVTTRQLLDLGASTFRNYIGEMELLIIAGLAVGVLSLGVLALRAVVDRRRAIGLMRAVGYQPRQLLAAVMGESLLTAAVGVVVGIAVGLFVGFVVVTRYDPGRRIDVQLDSLAVAIALIFVTAAVVTIGPALAVARTAPAEALRLID
jgi:putative ABC transport system permease protein